MSIFRTITILLGSQAALLAAEGEVVAPWLEPRSIEKFQSILTRSPFSLPTAEESAPAADRFFLTGAATINNAPVVFILDKNTQTRHMLSKNPNAQNNVLIEFQGGSDPKKMTARVRIEGQETLIHYAELPPEVPPPPAPQPPAAVQQPGAPKPGMPNPAGTPPQPPALQQGNNGQPNQPPRRVIRRRVISGQPQNAQPVPNQ